MTIAPLPTGERMPDGCRITTAVHGDIPAFHVFGEVVDDTAAHVQTVLAGGVGEATVLVDLAGVVSMDHAGFESVIGAVSRMRAGGALVAVASPSRTILATLRTRGLSRAVRLTSTSIEALGWLDWCRRGGDPEDGDGRAAPAGGRDT